MYRFLCSVAGMLAGVGSLGQAPAKRDAPRGIESLEPRTMLAGVLGPTEVVRGQAAEFTLVGDVTAAAEGPIIEALIGGQSLAPIALELDFPRHAVSSNGVLHVTGLSDGIGARQLLDLNTGILGPVEVFRALVGPGGDSQIEGAVGLNDGSIVYLGHSHNGLTGASPTYWLNDPTAPVGVTLTPGFSGNLEGSSAAGTIVGHNFGGAAVGQIGGFLEPLVGGDSNIALDISADGKFIVGTNGIWELTELGYQRIDTTGFGVPANGFVPQGFDGVAIDPVVGQAVFSGIYVDLNLFVENTGFWAEDGTLLGTFPGSFQDFQVWEGELVAGLNGQDDGWLLAISDFSAASMASITGQPGFVIENGLFEGSAGFLLNGPGGAFLTAYETVGDDPGGDGRFEIDWDGDGTIDEIVIGPSGTVVSHVFAETGDFPVTVNGSPALDVTVNSFGYFTEGEQTVLRIGAAAHGSRIFLSGDGLRIDRQFERLGTAFHRIEIFGQDGRDNITVFSDAEAAVFGRGGRDSIHFLGRGTAVIVGGTEADTILASANRALVVTGELELSSAALDEVFAALVGDSPDDPLRELLDGAVVRDDGAHDLVLALSGDVYGYLGDRDRAYPGCRWPWWRRNCFTEL